MGLFSNGKCPIHRIEYSIGKNYMCQQYLYCKKCAHEKLDAKERQKELEDLKRKFKELEDFVKKQVMPH